MKTRMFCFLIAFAFLVGVFGPISTTEASFIPPDPSIVLNDKK